MGRKKTPGLLLHGGAWHIDKFVYGQRVVETIRTGSLKEAERYLARRVEETRQAKVFGARPLGRPRKRQRNTCARTYISDL